MNGINTITDRIDQDAQQEINALTAKAQSEAAEITARYKAQAERETQAILQKGTAGAALRQERLASVAQLEARKMVLAAKQEMVEKAFERAMKNMVSLPDADYIALLAKLAAVASDTGREQIILSQKDRTRFGKQIVARANELLEKEGSHAHPGKLTLSEESRPMMGGLILRENRVETNCTFETLIHVQRDELAASVAKALFD
ncbi:MAG: V-type ATP synthase subunit E family protein [Intestinimonas sp.]|jgi:V/A-type H+-transporting ATPase subunit E|nr:V-type ATP synthase subunit E family protein [Intestinimonas sp.]